MATKPSSWSRLWLPVLLWMALIFFGSGPVGANQNTSRFLVPMLRWLVPGISDESLRRTQVLVRKTGHLTEYAVLSALLLRARMGSNPALQRGLPHATAFAVLVAAAFAITDELHQSFVPGREGSPLDVMIDVVGAIGGVLAGSAAAVLSRWHRCPSS